MATKIVRKEGLADEPEATSRLVGYVRLSRSKGSTYLSIDKKSFDECGAYHSVDGREFIKLVVNTDKLQEIISGGREVASVVYIAVDD